jgi:hypothetical protein
MSVRIHPSTPVPAYCAGLMTRIAGLDATGLLTVPSGARVRATETPWPRRWLRHVR